MGLEYKADLTVIINRPAYIIIILYHFKNHLSQALFELGRQVIMPILKMRKRKHSNVFVKLCVCERERERNKSHINEVGEIFNND